MKNTFSDITTNNDCTNVISIFGIMSYLEAKEMIHFHLLEVTV